MLKKTIFYLLFEKTDEILYDKNHSFKNVLKIFL